MPELPEVETMVRGLRPTLAGATIVEAVMVDPFQLQGCSREESERQVGGSEVASVNRRGKWVVIDLKANKGSIVIQPRMTGGFRLAEPTRPEHIRVFFRLGEPGKAVWFCDPRRLGKVTWYPDDAAAEAAFARSHGPDALVIAADDLAARLARTTRGIKPTLMDQKVLAGIGNIYADETLFRSRIHPERPAHTLTRDEVYRLHAAIGSVLVEAIAAEGSSFDAGYKTVWGGEGGFLNQNAMYGRGGKPCPECAGPVSKVKIAGLIGRPTHYCPTCQVLDGGTTTVIIAAPAPAPVAVKPPRKARKRAD